MRVCVYVCMRVCACACICVCKIYVDNDVEESTITPQTRPAELRSDHRYFCVPLRARASVCTRMFEWIYVCMCACRFVGMCVCTCANLHTCVCNRYTPEFTHYKNALNLSTVRYVIAQRVYSVRASGQYVYSVCVHMCI